jgi:hypothetical protein
MIKSPISLQDLRRKLYIKAKTEPSWRFESIRALTGNGGVGDGCRARLGFLMPIACTIHPRRRKRVQLMRSHKL